MRRLLVSITVLIGLIALPALAAGVWAAAQPVTPPAEPLIVAEPPGDWLPDEISVADLEPLSPDAAPAADTCAAATPLELSFGHTADGSGTLTNLYTQEPTDPVLSCTYGTPTNSRGYRTAWHVLVAGDTGVVTITTEGSDYDTILTVHEATTGTCDVLQAISCADDTHGLQSKTTFRVIRGRTYYIHVADYQSGAPASAVLRLSATMRAGGQRWRQVNTIPLGGISRHALASYFLDMFVIGGQTRIQGVPVLSNKLLRYNVEARRWTELDDMPGTGLSNTTAVRLAGKIYVPGGFDGNTSDYANTHLVYDIDTDFWSQAAPIPTALLPGGRMFAWSTAVAGPGETSYYTTGGLTSFPPLDADNVVISDTYRYTPSTNLWEAFRPMTTPRYAHTAAWVGDRGLCVAGGLSIGEFEGEPIIILLTGGECYNPATGAGWVATGPLNFPRYNAGSAVGPDGRWYIFGGVDATGRGVPEVEVFDAAANGWRVLGSDFSWGGRPTNPALEWPRGAFWGQNLYIFGGNTPHEQRVVSAVDQLSTGSPLPTANNWAFVPIAPKIGSDNVFFWATYLPPNTPHSANFTWPGQFFNPYTFDWGTFGRVTIRLRDVPDDSDFNVALYDANKLLRGQGNSPIYGQDEEFQVTLAPGRYYLLVERVFPKDLPDGSDFYSIGVYTP